MPRRQHHRVRLSLPVRLRWTTPLGQQTEECSSLDASRSGLLLTCTHRHPIGTRIWVTFPYNSALAFDQPEIPARIVRCRFGPNGSSKVALAVHYEIPLYQSASGNGHAYPAERRAAPRRPLSLPIHVRPAGVPWFEEAMTVDVSRDSLRFMSSREYPAGEPLFLSFKIGSSSPWLDDKEFRARIVRVETLPGTASLAFTVRRES